METIKIWSKEDWDERCRKYSIREMPIKLPRERRCMQMQSRYSQTPAEVTNKCLAGLWHAMETSNDEEEYKWRERLTYCGIDYMQQHSKTDFIFFFKVFRRIAQLKSISDYLPPHLIVCKGNCPYCGKELGEDDSIFICKECIRKDKEYCEKQSQIQEENEN